MIRILRLASAPLPVVVKVASCVPCRGTGHAPGTYSRDEYGEDEICADCKRHVSECPCLGGMVECFYCQGTGGKWERLRG